MLKKVVSVHPVSARSGPRRLGGPETRTAIGGRGPRKGPSMSQGRGWLPHGEVLGSSEGGETALGDVHLAT